MANAQARRALIRLPWRLLARPLAPAERARLSRELDRLLAWRGTLRGWPRVVFAPDATPFVSLYARGRLVGCCGSDEGSPAERLSRAFVRALADRRAAALAAGEPLDAQVCYLRAARPLDLATAAAELEVGADGVASLGRGGASILLPQVARDGALDPARLLAALERKAAPSGGAAARLFALRGDEVSSGDRPSRADPIALARRWLAARVAADGAVDFALDPHLGESTAPGPMHHGRAAMVVAALAAAGDPAAVRARRWLAREIERALAGRPVASWPDDPPRLAGTLSLAALAGVRSDGAVAALAALAAHPALERAPWHAAQVACALGAAAPDRLWRACVAALDGAPWAPWTLLAASARGDGETRARAERPLVDSLRRGPPHRGGAEATAVPELALTALAVEALAGSTGTEARAAARRGRAFLLRWQILPGRRSAALAPAALGAFPASPVAALLRCDITAHALAALLARRNAKPSFLAAAEPAPPVARRPRRSTHSVSARRTEP